MSFHVPSSRRSRFRTRPTVLRPPSSLDEYGTWDANTPNGTWLNSPILMQSASVGSACHQIRTAVRRERFSMCASMGLPVTEYRPHFCFGPRKRWMICCLTWGVSLLHIVPAAVRTVADVAPPAEVLLADSPWHPRMVVIEARPLTCSIGDAP